MTVPECREILQEEALNMTDDEIVDYIEQAGVLAEAILNVASNSLLTHNKN